VDRHDDVLLGERHRIAPIWPFIDLLSPGMGPRGHEASHHAAILELVMDGVCVVRPCFLEEPPKVVRRRPHLMLVAMCGGQDSSHDRVPRLVIVVIGRSRGPLKALLVSLSATFDALLGAVCGCIRRCLLVTAWGHLHASLGRAKHDCLIASSMLGVNNARLLEHVP
jgi:hypothetical protein